MIEYLLAVLILILIGLFLFDLDEKTYTYLILGIFSLIFLVVYLESPYYLALPISGSITLIYFISIIIMSIIRLSFVNYMIVFLISLGFAMYGLNRSNLAQVIIDLAFYSIIILVIRLISEGSKNE